MKNFVLGSMAALLAIVGCQQTSPSSSPPASATAPELPAGVTQLETLTRQPGDEVVIPYTKYRLDNGLVVILHEDRSDPLVHVDVTYHVGSAREEIGKSGFAHFFEHMMFQGSTNVGDEQHFKIVSESGGTLNGTTNTDRTNYFQTVPSNQLEKVLWLEADRMGFLLDAVTQEKFEVQRDTVKNERGQRMDNRPYGLLFERVGEALYPEGHPYSWSVIGYVEDLDRVDVNDLKKFFLRWYGPNNAALTIGGDFDREQTLAWVVKYFGSIPRGPEVAMPEKPVVRLPATRYISMEDNVALPLIYMAFPTVYRFHPDEAPLDVLMFVLGTGETSLLYKNMVKNQLAVQAGSNHQCGELSCTFTVMALPNPATGKTLADLEQIARDSLLEFESRGVTDDDLERAKMNIVSSMIYGLESVSGKISQIAHYQTLTGRADYIAEDVARYENVTAEDVMRVYEQYIAGQPSVVMSIVPQGALALRAGEDTWERYQRQLPDYEAVPETDLDYRPAADDFDRAALPPAGDNPAITLPAIWRGELKNGIRLLGARNPEVPTTAVSLRLAVGQRHESLAQLGLAALTAGMLNEATELSSNEELSDRLQKLGSTITFVAGDDDTIANVRSLTKNLDETLAILAEKLMRPKFDPADFARLQAQTLQSIETSRKEAAVTADVVFWKLLFGHDNSVSHPDIGTVATVASLTIDDVRAFYQAHYSPTVAGVVAVSDLDGETMRQKLAVLEEWQGASVPSAALAAFPDTGKTKIYLVDKPAAAQSEIRIGKRSLAFDATGEYYRAGLANFALGGAFNSRINLNLREDKGYTYGARSYHDGRKDRGAFIAQAGVRTDATAASIREFESEIRGYATNGISADELAFTKNAIGQRDARNFETPRQKVAFLSRILMYDLADDFVDRQNEILAEVTAAELNALASKHLVMDDMVIVVVGDRSVVQPELDALGYDIVHLDADGNAR